MVTNFYFLVQHVSLGDGGEVACYCPTTHTLQIFDTSCYARGEEGEEGGGERKEEEEDLIDFGFGGVEVKRRSLDLGVGEEVEDHERSRRRHSSMEGKRRMSKRKTKWWGCSLVGSERFSSHVCCFLFFFWICFCFFVFCCLFVFCFLFFVFCFFFFASSYSFI